MIALIPGLSERAIKRTAAVFTFIPLALAVYLFVAFERSQGFTGAMQFEGKVSWIPAINAFYHVGVDGISLPLVLLMAILGFLVVLISWKVHLRVKEYFAWLLLLETSILGVFASLDLLLFFLFWEIEIMPMYFLISIWGTGRRDYSAMKYVILHSLRQRFYAGRYSGPVFYHRQPGYAGNGAEPSAQCCGHYSPGSDLLLADHRLCH